jgi:hypothetical protein
VFCAPLEPLAAKTENALASLQNRLRRCGAGQQQYLWLGKHNGAFEERCTGGLLLRRRRAVAGRAPEDGVGDENLAVQASRADHAVQELACAADEGLAACILFGAGTFSDDHHRCAGPAAREDGARGAGEFERATVIGGDRRLELVERIGRRRQRLGVAKARGKIGREAGSDRNLALGLGGYGVGAGGGGTRRSLQPAATLGHAVDRRLLVGGGHSSLGPEGEQAGQGALRFGICGSGHGLTIGPACAVWNPRARPTFGFCLTVAVGGSDKALWIGWRIP